MDSLPHIHQQLSISFSYFKIKSKNELVSYMKRDGKFCPGASAFESIDNEGLTG